MGEALLADTPIDPRLIARRDELAQHRLPEAEADAKIHGYRAAKARSTQGAEPAWSGLADWVMSLAPTHEEDRVLRERIEREQKSQEEREHYDRWAAVVGLPEHKLKLAWEPAKRSDALTQTGNWLRGKWGEVHLFMFGGTRCGKTFAQAAAVRYWTKAGRTDTVEWLSADQFIDAMLHQRDGEYRFKRRVIVDDVGFETKPGMADALKKALECKGRQQFFFSSNLPRESNSEQLCLRDKYPMPALLRRLNETSQAVYVVGEDMCPRDGGF